MAAPDPSGSLSGLSVSATQVLNPVATSADSGDKPQSKVWEYNDTWWAVFSNNQGTFVWRLDGTDWTQVTRNCPEHEDPRRHQGCRR